MLMSSSLRAGSGEIRLALLRDKSACPEIGIVVRFAAKPDVKQLPDSAVTKAFGNRASGKCVQQLRSAELAVRCQALLAAEQLLAQTGTYVQCLTAEMPAALTDLLKEQDDAARLQAAVAMRLVAGKAPGVHAMLRSNTLSALVALLQDKLPAVRDAAYGCMAEASRFEAWCTALVVARVLPSIFKLALAEEPERAALGLTVAARPLRCACGEDALQQLTGDVNAVLAITPLLSGQSSVPLQQAAACLLAALCTKPFTRTQAVTCRQVPVLLGQLGRGWLPLASAAAEALMAITVAVEGKQAVADVSGGCHLILQLLDVEAPSLRLPLVELISNVAELPAGRKALHGAAPVLQDLQWRTSDRRLQNSLAQAVRQLGFQSLPFEHLPPAGDLVATA
eukprot:jgi/Astpho2/234/Aster-x0907